LILDFKTKTSNQGDPPVPRALFRSETAAGRVEVGINLNFVWIAV